MLEHYFNKLQLDFTSGESEFGSTISSYTSNFPNLEKVKIALIGQSENSNTIRKHLYKLGNISLMKNTIVDLGNIKNHENEQDFLSALYLVIEELINLNIVPIFIGKDMNQGFALYRGIKQARNQIQLTCISSKIPIAENQLLSRITEDEAQKINAIHILAYQSHYATPEKLDLSKNKKIKLLRLGQLKSNIEESELYLRDSNLALFDINAIQYADAPGKETINPSGLTSEEACQISKYAGMSDDNQCFGLFGYLPQLDNNELTAALCSQLIWYFINGFYSRMNDKPENHQDFMKYRCDFSDRDTPILFLKSKLTSRWWMKIEHPAEPNNSDLTLTIPCSYEDYLIAANGETPERYLNALQALK